MMRFPPTFRPPLAGALLLSLLLVACGRDESERSAGERLDTATAKAEAQLESARSAASEAAGATVAAGADAAITARVKAGLAADSGLESTAIGVETRDGRTVLQGTVKDGAARDRASQVAAAVDGVTAVDNQLVVGN